MRLTIPRPRTIRSRLLVFLVLIAVLTAAAIIAVTIVFQSRDARDRVVGQLKSVMSLKQQEILTWTNGLRLNLDIVLSETNIPLDLRSLLNSSPVSKLHQDAYDRIQQRFMWAANRMELFEELFFLDKNGNVLLSTVPSHENEKLGLNDYFVQGLKGKFIQQPSYSLSLRTMTIVASCPVEQGGEIIGVLAGRASLTGLNKIMIERPGLGATGETYLVGSNHRLLTYLRRSGYDIPDTYIRTEGTDAAVDGGLEGSATYRGYSGATVIGVYDWIPELKVALIAEQEESEALHATRVALVATGGVAVLAAALAIIAGIVLTRSIVRPLSQLGATASRITAGELDLRADVHREDEIGTLARTFNTMTTQLSDLVRNLERRSDHLRAINVAGRHISSILELDELLPYVARSLVETFNYESVRILLLTGPTGGRLLTCVQNDCRETPHVELAEMAAGVASAVATVARTGEALLLTGAAHDDGEATAGQGDALVGNGDALVAGAAENSEIAVPIRVGDDLVGVMAITAGASNVLDEQDLVAAQTLADQLAIAIENSRLYLHAHELAASRERQRLARDLHDAVSQTLFSVSLIAEVLPRIYERDPEQGRARLEELRQLTRGALAEMRTLLLELRPAALAEANLADLLKQLTEAVIGRSRIPVELEVEGHIELPTDVRVALYRISQEALNNVAKHSGAGHARVSLKSQDGALRLTVEDDGSGFDAESAGAGQLGLGIMRERAEAAGATLEMRSSPGEGTTVTVTWPGATPST